VQLPARTYPAECEQPYWNLGEQIVSVHGTKATVVEVLRSFVARGVPDGGGLREEGGRWVAHGNVTDDELRRMRAFCRGGRCEVEVVKSKDSYSDQIYAVYCARPARR
jgi:hypothetical protein